MTSPYDALDRLGIELPEVAAPVAAYVPAVRSGDHVYVSGQLPWRDGELIATGTVGDDVSAETAAQCARQCALNGLAAVASVVPLDQVRRVVKAVVFVASSADFTGQPGVANGASELFQQVFGDAGVHARSAVGVTALPLGTPVEVELVVEVAPQAA